MPTVNWGIFAELPGAADVNFELLCRALIRRHYGRFGNFFALANQPGVEFHLKLHSPCPLGKEGRWYGWQCRWYDLPSGRPIGTTRRKKIQEAIAKTESELPGLTDWVLWTRHHLTESDQKWFYDLQTHMRLHLWTMAEVEEHLSGPAEILRSTYFGDLVLTPELLTELHIEAIAPIKRRWQPEVHQVVDAERALRRALGAVEVWSDLLDLTVRLENDTEAVLASISNLPAALEDEMHRLVGVARALAAALTQTHWALIRGDFEVLRQRLANRITPDSEWDTLLRRLRSGRYSVSLITTNLVAGMYGAHKALTILHDVLTWCLVAVVADAGCGKTELAAQITAPSNGRPAGVLLHGRNLHAGQRLDDLARSVVIQGRPVPSFEALAAAIDAAGQRASRRLPIVIDGLNEAEDPRDWKTLLASLPVMLQRYSYVMVVCTLRSAFIKETLPEDVDRLEIPDFDHDTTEAVRRYFKHYLIDPADAELPWRLLQHPLTLRMFCEVTNPDRKRTVGVEAMPGSLTGLFDRYLEQVAERIAQLSPRAWRYFESDVRTALNSIGLALWEAHARSLDTIELRRRLGDDVRPWNTSIVTALEHDGVLLRVSGDRPSAGHVAIVYDALAGHLIADALLDQFGGPGFEVWLRNTKTAASLLEDLNQRHPLSTDIFRGLVGLVPRRMYRRQLWPLLEEPARTEALYEAAWLEGAYLDRDTVSQLAALVVQTPSRHRDLLDRLLTTRAARPHPLDAAFLDAALRSMPLPDRDLRWTEWLRHKQEAIIKDIQRLESRWRAGQTHGEGNQLRARWVMWTLTSTVRLLRDHATRALYWFGCNNPDELFNLALDSLTVNDPYIPERMLAACYGVTMSLWSDLRGSKVRTAIPVLANALVDRMFMPEAVAPTRHILMRDYALGVISVALKLAPDCVSADKMRYLLPPFDHLPSPFPPAIEIDDTYLVRAKGAIQMDFGNYTIGRLIPNRRNYDNNNTAYRDVRRQIEHRIVELGYTSDRFAETDKMIGAGSWRSEGRGDHKTDRYGKKYSWIAYFEMYGLRLDEGSLSESRASERTSDADIDPSFPELARSWMPSLSDLFSTAPNEPRAWLADGPTPDYDDLLYREEVDGQQGPWVLLEGYVEQSAKDDGRRVFTFLRGLLAKHDEVTKILAAFDAVAHPGNMAIPEPQEDYYTYAGEIPWSSRFGSALRRLNGRAKRDDRRAFALHDGKRWMPGIPVEVPVLRFAWESYHSVLNQVSGAKVPAPALCERLHLSKRQGEWDLYDRTGQVASLYREFKTAEDSFDSKLLYLRADLMADYLKRTNQVLVWLVWGERGFDHRTTLEMTDRFERVYLEHRHIHRCSSYWIP